MSDHTKPKRREVLKKTAAIGAASLGGVAFTGAASACDGCKYEQGDPVVAEDSFGGVPVYEECVDDADDYIPSGSEGVVDFCCEKCSYSNYHLYGVNFDDAGYWIVKGNYLSYSY